MNASGIEERRRLAHKDYVNGKGLLYLEDYERKITTEQEITDRLE